MRIRMVVGELKGQVISVKDSEAMKLIKKGKAILSKDMTPEDYKLTSDEEQADGHTTKLRSNH